MSWWHSWCFEHFCTFFFFELSSTSSSSSDAPLCVSEALSSLSRRFSSLSWAYPSPIPVLQSLPPPIVFLRDYVQNSRPALLETGCLPVPPPGRFSRQNLLDTIGEDHIITVAVTGTGRADSVVDGVFVKPYERRMRFGVFLEGVGTAAAGGHGGSEVLYASRQNSSLTEEFPALVGLLPDPSPWLKEVFGANDVDAVNLWLGDRRSVTSAHRDNYENFYLVLRGQKTFTLFPPTDAAVLGRIKRWPAATLNENLEAVLDEDENHVPWIEHDLGDLDVCHSLGLHPVVVTVKQGQALYLPACVFHHVAQDQVVDGVDQDFVLAVNWWVDMNFSSPLWSLLRLIDSLNEL